MARTGVVARVRTSHRWTDDHDEREISGPGGRTLLVHEAGDPDGALVVYHHGTPQSGLMLESWEDHAAASRVRLVSYDRPGYGGSAPQPRRAVADAAGDVAAIAEALGAERLATFGASGGGPHALACAALLGDRVAAAAVLGTIAPFAAEGLNYFAGMGRDNWVEFGAALVGRETLEPMLVAEIRERAGAPAAAVADGIRRSSARPTRTSSTAVSHSGCTRRWCRARRPARPAGSTTTSPLPSRGASSFGTSRLKCWSCTAARIASSR